MKLNKICQSCGMPLKKDPQGGGTNADGSTSLLYCSHCFRDGFFTRPGITVGEMKTLVKEKLKEMNFPGFLAVMMTLNINKLGRWKR